MITNCLQVLDAVMNEKYGKANCFVERESAFCGNNIVEVGEQCDCGYQADCVDSCCYGRGSASQCRLKETDGVQCRSDIFYSQFTNECIVTDVQL